MPPTFGGINLEDVAAPTCFEIEEALIERCDIPVFHDDQHGTAIVMGAALLNALELQGKKIEDARIVFLGAGAAGAACMRLAIDLGARRENMWMVDRKGVILPGREDFETLNKEKREFAGPPTERRTLAGALAGADVFIGVSGPGLMKTDWLMLMNEKPIVFALLTDAGDSSGRSARGPQRPDHGDRTKRLSEPSQQCDVLSVPVPRRPRCPCAPDQQRNESGSGACAGRAGA